MVLAKTGLPMPGPLRDRRARNTYRALRLSRGMSRQIVAVWQSTTRSRTALVCCRAWDAGCRAVRLLFSCCRGIRLRLGGWPFAPSRQEFAHPSAAPRRLRLVVGPQAAEFLPATL